MSKHSIRLGSTITFDSEKERDIIAKIDYIKGKHKLGDFISNLLRIGLDSPYKLESKEKIDKALEDLEANGISYDRADYFKMISKEIEVMKARVDEIYDMNLKLLTMAKFGKQIGLEGKTENMLMSQFVLERQLTSICDILGIEHANHVFNSNKIQDTKEKAESVLEYIIESYDGIIGEIKNGVANAMVSSNVQNNVIASSNIAHHIENKEQLQIQTGELKEETKLITENIASEAINKIDEPELIETKTEEVEGDKVDFLLDDIDTLTNFFGD